MRGLLVNMFDMSIDLGRGSEVLMRSCCFRVTVPGCLSRSSCYFELFVSYVEHVGEEDAFRSPLRRR